MAEIFNTNSNTLLSGTSGDDYILNGGFGAGVHYVTINSGAGDDLIKSFRLQKRDDFRHQEQRHDNRTRTKNFRERRQRQRRY